MHPLVFHRDLPFLITAGSVEAPAACACRTLTDNAAADSANSMARPHRFAIPPPSKVVGSTINCEIIYYASIPNLSRQRQHGGWLATSPCCRHVSDG